jgi:hypothetical protein
MSSPVITSVDTTIATEVKVKNPTLLGKFKKLSVFGFWLSQQVDVSDETREQLLAALKVFESVEAQTAFFESFTEAEKDTAKAMRKAVAAHNKPVKTKKAAKEKAPRKGKAVIQQDELIAKLIADATSPIGEPQSVVDKEAEKQAKLAEKEAEKQAKLAEKEAEKQAKLAEKEAEKQAKLAEKEAEKQAKLAEKEAEKQAKIAEKEAEKQAKLAKEAEKQVIVSEKPVKTTQKQKKQEPVAEEPAAAPVEVSEQAIDEITATLSEIAIAESSELVEEPIAPVAAVSEKPAKKEKVAKKSEKEPKAKKETKPTKKEQKKPVAAPVEEELEEEAVETRVVIIGDKEFLLDSDFNLYNTEAPHDHVGTYNQETGEIQPL